MASHACRFRYGAEAAFCSSFSSNCPISQVHRDSPSFAQLLPGRYKSLPGENILSQTQWWCCQGCQGQDPAPQESEVGGGE